jgi:hypothetical protein
MKILLKKLSELQAVGRWDIDFHLPAEGIKQFPEKLLTRVDSVADIAKDKRDPTKEPDGAFQYIDISSVDIVSGTISNPQDLIGAEAPSRARKVVRAFDLIVSTCRPTRGAIAVVPVKLHNQIASTGFSIVRPHSDVNPFYLHYALRLTSTLEQFRKWSTGSSYPAILNSDVAKTLIPVPDRNLQDVIAAKVVAAMRERAKTIGAANAVWTNTLDEITGDLCGRPIKAAAALEPAEQEPLEVPTLEAIQSILKDLPPIRTDEGLTLSEEDEPA